VNESSDTRDKPGKPEDYAVLRAELAELVDEFTPVAGDVWPHLEDHKYRWELYSYGLPDGYDKLVASDIIDLLIEALKGIGVARNKLVHAQLKVDEQQPGNADATRHRAPMENQLLTTSSWDRAGISLRS
jgi:hypothetical protein